MSILKPWHDPQNWQVEFSPTKDACLITRIRDGRASLNEIYPITVFGDRTIDVVRQMGEDEFVFISGYVMRKNLDPFLTRMKYNHVKLQNGEVRMLESHPLRREHEILYSKAGMEAYARLLAENGLKEAEPKFQPLGLKGKRVYDHKRYEAYATSQYFIIKDLEDERICAHHTGMKCLGFRQVGNEFLALFEKNGRYVLKRFEDEGFDAELRDGIIRNGFADNGFSNKILELPNLECQIDENRIYTLEGQYLISEDCLMDEPTETLERAVVQDRQGKTLVLDLVVDGFYETPKVLALVDPLSMEIVGKPLNLVTEKFEVAHHLSDLRTIANRTSEQEEKSKKNSA